MANVTKTVKSSGGDYTSLNAALAGMSGNLTTDCGGSGGAGILTIECYAMNDTTDADTGTGYTTSSSYYINITSPSSERHAGVWSTSKYRLVCSNSYGGALTLQENYVKVTYLQIHNSNADRPAGINCPTTLTDNANLITIAYNLIKVSPSGNQYGYKSAPIRTVGDYIDTRIYNNILYDGRSGNDDSYGINISSFGSSNLIYNNTIANCETGVYSDNNNTVTLKNNIFTSCDVPATGTYAAGTDYNVTDHDSMHYTVTGGGNSHDHTSHTFTFTDSDNDNYHLGSTDTGAIDLGVSDPGSGLFSDDIDGESRSGSWDCGADEYVSAGGSIPLSNPFSRPFSQSLGRGGF